MIKSELKMKTRGNVYTTLIVLLLFAPQIISGCTAPASNDLFKKDVYKGEIDLIGQGLFRDKCSLCHELPDIGSYPYTPVQWVGIIDYMHDIKEARKFMTIEEAEKIKIYLKRLSGKDR